MIRTVCLGLLLVTGFSGWASAQVPYPGLLAEPGDYSFAPPADKPGGVASASVGSHNTRTSSIELDSGLIGNTGIRAFVALGAGHGADLSRGADGARVGVTSRGGAVGIQKAFANGTVFSLESSWQRDHLNLGRSAGYMSRGDAPAGPP